MNNELFYGAFLSAICTRFCYKQSSIACDMSISVSTFSRICSGKQQLSGETFKKYIKCCANLKGFKDYQDSPDEYKICNTFINKLVVEFIEKGYRSISLSELKGNLKNRYEFSPGYFKYQTLKCFLQFLNNENIEETINLIRNYPNQFSNLEKAWLLDMYSISLDDKKMYLRELEILNEALNYVAAADNPKLEGIILYHKSQTEFELGKFELAIETLEKAKYPFSKIFSPFRHNNYELLYSCLLMNLHLYHFAVERFNKLLNTLTEEHKSGMQDQIYGNLTWIYTRINQYGLAQEMWHKIKEPSTLSNNFLVLYPFLCFKNGESELAKKNIDILLPKLSAGSDKSKIVLFLRGLKAYITNKEKSFEKISEQYNTLLCRQDHFVDYFFLDLELNFYAKVGNSLKLFQTSQYLLTCSQNFDYEELITVS